MKSDREMAQSVLKRRDAYMKERSARGKKLGVSVACFTLCGLIGAGAWQSGLLGTEFVRDDPTAVSGENTLPDTTSPEATQGQPIATEANPVPDDDPTGAPENVDPTQDDKLMIDCASGTPTWSAADLTEEALYDAVGALLPDSPPDGFQLESAHLTDYGYSVIWYRGLEELNWRIRDYGETDAHRLTDVEDTVNYDLALYPIPRADSVPEELREIVDDPIFLGEQLTRDAVHARAYKVSEVGDSDGYRMHFSVRLGDKLITVSSKGVSPDWLYEQLSAVAETA